MKQFVYVGRDLLLTEGAQTLKHQKKCMSLPETTDSPTADFTRAICHHCGMN